MLLAGAFDGLVGLPEELGPRVDAVPASQRRRLEIVPASEVVAMDEPPADALRKKKDSSMRVALNLVRDGDADACVSAGNTGALMATARYVLKTLPGIDRPAIMSAIPARGGHTHMLDLGANSHCTPAQIGKLIRRIRRVDRKLGKGLGVLVDLQGPKIRVGMFKNSEPIWLRTGKDLIISTEPGVVGQRAKSGETTRIGTRYGDLAKYAKPRARVLLDDGNIELRVVRVEGTEIHTRVVHGGLLKQLKGISCHRPAWGEEGKIASCSDAIGKALEKYSVASRLRLEATGRVVAQSYGAEDGHGEGNGTANGGRESRLGVGCSDPYSSFLNGS